MIEATKTVFRCALWRGGCSIFIVTHRIAELVRIADALQMRDGRSVGTLEKVQITEENIMQLIAGPERQQAQGSRGHAINTEAYFART